MKRIAIEFFVKILDKLGYRISKHDELLYESFLKKNMINEPCIFDCGAFIGNITKLYKNIFRNSKIHCFEPIKSSFTQLKENTKDLANIFYNNNAVSNIEEIISFNVNEDPSRNSISKPSNDYFVETISQEKVKAITIDEYCNQKGINKIDLLKIDVEGHEKQVIEGAKNMINQNNIYLISIEVMFDKHYENQVLFGDIFNLLKEDFYLISFYNLKHSKRGILRWGDALFANIKHYE